MARNIVIGREAAEIIMAGIARLILDGEDPLEWLPERLIVTHDTNPGNRGPLPEWWDGWNLARERVMRGVIIFRQRGREGDLKKIVRRFEFKAEFLVYRDRTSHCLYACVDPIGQSDENREEVLAQARE